MQQDRLNEVITRYHRNMERRISRLQRDFLDLREISVRTNVYPKKAKRYAINQLDLFGA